MASLTLIPSKNTYVTSRKPHENFADAPVLLSGVDAKYNIYRTLIEFDLLPLPANIVIDAAFLYMHADYMKTKNMPGVFTPYLILSKWDENSVTWNNKPEYNPSIPGSAIELSDRGWYCWDIKCFLEMWISNCPNYGILLNSSENVKDDIKKIHSLRSYYYRNLRPYIEVLFSYKNTFSLDSRNTASSIESYNASDVFLFSKWQNVSGFSCVTFFIQNQGVHPINAFIQISPDRNAIVNEPAYLSVSPGETEALVPQRFGFFTRIAFRSVSHGQNSTIKIWFQAQV